jgi:hypothetical protein
MRAARLAKPSPPANFGLAPWLADLPRLGVEAPSGVGVIEHDLELDLGTILLQIQLRWGPSGDFVRR